jgi:membrane protein
MRLTCGVQALEAQLAKHRRLNILVGLTRNVVYEQGNDRTGLAAAGVAFWIVLSIFPATIAVGTVYGLVLGQARITELLVTLSSIGPEGLDKSLTTELSSLTTTSSLSISLVVSLVISIWSVSAATYSFARSVLLSHDLPPRPWLVARARAFVAAVIVIIAVGLIAVALSVADSLNQSVQGGWRVLLIVVVEVPAWLAAVSILLVGNYRYSLGRDVGFKALVPGAFLSAVCLAGFLVGYSYYLSHFSSISRIYGAFAGIVGALLIAYFSMYIILLGAVLNHELIKSSQANS